VKPSDALKPRDKGHFARIEARELPELLRHIDAYTSPITRLALQFMALTFVRTGELIAARWDELDMKAFEWRIPAQRMKMKTPHIVPLTPQALKVLAELRPLTGNREHLFPGGTNPRGAMSNGAILGALKRMGYAGRMTGHGFRGIASTILHEQGYPHHQSTELKL
jgi:integrase